MKKIVLITGNHFPDSTAMTIRYQSMMRVFQANGYDTLVLSRGPDTHGEIKEYHGIKYISKTKNYRYRWMRGIDLYVLFPLFCWSFLRKTTNDSVWLNLGDDCLLRYLKRNTSRFQLLYDAVEWYSPSEFAKGEKSREYRRNNEWTTRKIDKNFRVISISSFLEKYFCSRGIPTVRIPVIMDVANAPCKKTVDHDKIVIMYAGSPGKKDYLKEVVEGCAMLKQTELAKLELRLIGITKSQLCSFCGVSDTAVDTLGDALVCCGRVPHDQVVTSLEEASFTILLRPAEERYAKAGFPTKVVESLASATPVICNLTSDLGMYINDMKNGIVVNACAADAVRDAVSKALSIDEEARKTMFAAARVTAEECFDYRNYIPVLHSLISPDTKEEQDGRL